MLPDLKIAVIGLGYVGLPLAVALAAHYPNVLGFDIDKKRIDEIQSGYDRTDEVSAETLKATTLQVTTDVTQLQTCTLFIVTVPTPVDDENQPDLTALRVASETVATVLKKGDIVVFESTVYPGVTENVCGKILAEKSGLVCGQDFMLGYSPERINPGDRTHTLETITKVVSGQTDAVTELLSHVYGSINGGKIFKAASIKVAEAAKVIENAQRDINIAFINEIAIIFSKLGISIYDVLEAAGTKWNFLHFTPGLVGGHCIGVDPFYLAECSMKLGHVPKVILAGREMNDQMAHLLASRIEKRLPPSAANGNGRLLILGLTFKENVPDLRNTKVVDMIHYFRQRGYTIDIHDPHADPAEAQAHYNLRILKDNHLESCTGPYHGIIAAVRHQEYVALDLKKIQTLLRTDGLLADLKAIWRSQSRDQQGQFNYWTL
jgi:UDP-N-acetyl-D-galactosamine dehydrogenase